MCASGVCAVCVVLCVCAVCVVLCVVLCVCCVVLCVCVCVPEHWLSSKQTKLSSKITCHSLALLICWCVCVHVCMCVWGGCQMQEIFGLVLAVYVYPEE